MEIKLIEGEANQYKESESTTVFSFGKIKENSIAKVVVRIEGVDDSSLTATCGCSVVKSTEKNLFTVQYNNTHITEPFAKVFILNYRENDSNKQAQIKLTGNVIK